MLSNNYYNIRPLLDTKYKLSSLWFETLKGLTLNQFFSWNICMIWQAGKRSRKIINIRDVLSQIFTAKAHFVRGYHIKKMWSLLMSRIVV